jgi:hypothetical protein
MILITIISSRKIEYIPIIYEFLKETNKHIIIFDNEKKDRVYAEELKVSIKKLNQKYYIKSDIEMIEIDEDSKKDMQEIIKIFDGQGNKNYLNGAGSDTALFTVLSSIVLRNDGKVLAYDKEDNNYNIITQNGFSNKQIEKCMNIEDFLTLMGEEILEEVSKEEILLQKEALNKLFSDTKRMFRIRFLLKRHKTKELKKRYSDMLEVLQQLGIVNEEYLINGQEGFVKFGYLFEQFVFLQLDVFDFDDIKVGVKIRFDEEQVERCNIDVTNEFDILLINENKIGFIECKIGDSHDPLGTIYKSDSIMEYFGENASSLIVNIERNKTTHLKNSKKNFGASLLFRAETKKVMVYNAFDFRENGFRKKIKEAFGFEIKEKYLKEKNQKSLYELEKKWEKL